MHDDEEVAVLISSIRTIPSVQLITEMTNEKIKNKQHLIFLSPALSPKGYKTF